MSEGVGALLLCRAADMSADIRCRGGEDVSVCYVRVGLFSSGAFCVVSFYTIHSVVTAELGIWCLRCMTAAGDAPNRVWGGSTDL